MHLHKERRTCLQKGMVILIMLLLYSHAEYSKSSHLATNKTCLQQLTAKAKATGRQCHNEQANKITCIKKALQLNYPS